HTVRDDAQRSAAGPLQLTVIAVQERVALVVSGLQGIDFRHGIAIEVCYHQILDAARSHPRVLEVTGTRRRFGVDHDIRRGSHDDLGLAVVIQIRHGDVDSSAAQTRALPNERLAMDIVDIHVRATGTTGDAYQIRVTVTV